MYGYIYIWVYCCSSANVPFVKNQLSKLKIRVNQHTPVSFDVK